MFSEKITCHYLTLSLRYWAPQVVLEVKNLPANAGDVREGFDPWVEKIPPEKETATHSSTLSWKSPWTEKPGGLQFMGLQRIGHD